MPEINIFENALSDITDLFDRHEISYMVIGGLANARWGRPRATLDIDITVWAPGPGINTILALLQKDYIPLIENPVDFIAQTRVLPVKTKDDQRIDIIFGALPFERTAIDRAVKVPVGSTTVNFCTPEDLILLKIISDRPKDSEDVRGILAYQKEKLDFDYLEPRIAELAGLLEKPGISRQWESWKKELMLSTG
jgi:hypothetical protein